MAFSANTGSELPLEKLETEIFLSFLLAAEPIKDKSTRLPQENPLDFVYNDLAELSRAKRRAIRAICDTSDSLAIRIKKVKW
ncbi:MAG: hypothetical protein LBT59_12485 [Clostridiales bacterium]|nr:hypothetical protein [Clostridiales bacterium]